MDLYKICLPLLKASFLMTLSCAHGYAKPIEMIPQNSTGSMYMGIFAGGGQSTKGDINQFGMSFYTEADGGPLAVNAYGQAKEKSLGFLGAHIGYQWIESPINASWGIAPAIELEGYYIAERNIEGSNINSETTRIDEHQFLLTYPTKTSVFLTNFVLNFNLGTQYQYQPYIGVGFGAAIHSITNAVSEQTAPAEPGVNHYNGGPSDTKATFAAQTKLGFNYQLMDKLKIFAEYKLLYLSNSNFKFGSTDYPGHNATSTWLVDLGAHYNNMASIGINYTL